MANPDAYQIREDALLDLGPEDGVLANDTDDHPPSLLAVLVDEPSHGTLHLAGYDHEHPADAARMEALEKRILAGLGFDDPYECD